MQTKVKAKDHMWKPLQIRDESLPVSKMIHKLVTDCMLRKRLSNEWFYEIEHIAPGDSNWLVIGLRLRLVLHHVG